MEYSQSLLCAGVACATRSALALARFNKSRTSLSEVAGAVLICVPVRGSNEVAVTSVPPVWVGETG
ncbi:hypothetical protein GCM10009712_37900 [Pseudarthrobacter sulfonivorans]